MRMNILSKLVQYGRDDILDMMSKKKERKYLSKVWTGDKETKMEINGKERQSEIRTWTFRERILLC